MTAQFEKRPVRSKFHRHTDTLIWKSYLQRQRRWRLLLLETLFAAIMFLIAVFIAEPVFLTPLQAVPRAPLTSANILATLNKRSILGYAPNHAPYEQIMNIAAQNLGFNFLSAGKEDDLNRMLYNLSRGTPIDSPIIWVIWKPTKKNVWKFSIRSTERAKYVMRPAAVSSHNPHLSSGVLALQLAVSNAILTYVSITPLNYELQLSSMPVSPLMQQDRVRTATSSILMCFTLALLPPVLETQALLVSETISRFKRALRIRDVDYSSMYTGWLVYAYLTAAPVCVLGSVTLILIFRWVHLLFTLILVLAYVSVMIMLAMIMAMYQNETWIACLWTALVTLLQTFLSELIVHHGIDLKHEVFTFFLHLIIPPLGLMHGLSEFALLQTGQGGRWESNAVIYTILSWLIMIIVYFELLMILQRTVKQKAIGGQVSWKSIVFKKVADAKKLHQIETPSGKEREKLQEVDELVAKAISIRNVTKSIMGGPVLSNVTLDIYRGEFTKLYSEPVQENTILAIEDLLTGKSK